MTKNFKRAMIASMIAYSTVQTVPASAFGGRCGGGGGSIRSHIGSFIGSHAAHPPVQSRPAYSQPAYSQPAYSQPAYSQPAHSQPAYPQPGYSQPAYSQPSSAPPAPSSMIPSAVPQAPQFAGQNVAANTNDWATGSTTSSGADGCTVDKPVECIQCVGSGTVHVSPSNAGVNHIGCDASRRNSACQRDAVGDSRVRTAPSAVSNVNAGTWKVSLPGNQSVELVLRDDGQFSWTATKSGATSAFAGTYQLTGDQLTLVRSNDQQQMRGTWTANDSGFIFKLDGATTGGLNFHR